MGLCEHLENIHHAFSTSDCACIRYFFWICIFLGAIKALIYAIETTNFIIRHLPKFRKAGYLLERYGGAGSWAVVTGASDGIGAEYCRVLAKEGFNVVLVSRTLSKLQSVDAELRKINNKVKT